MSAVFELSGLQKSYDGRVVLDIDALDVQDGEILAVVGPSGAGKSTLLRILNFLEKPDSGRVSYYGTEINFLNVPIEIQRSVTTVFQRPALISGSVTANVNLGLRLRARKDGTGAMENILEQVGLKQLKRVQALTLSGGEAQRVALARALILHPKVLLLDEPTANLDPYNVELIERVIRDLNRNEKTTIILVTHNIFQAHRLANRVAFMLNGRFVEIADSHNFFENPSDERTRAFIRGDMVW